MVLHSARSEQEQNVPLLIDAHDGIDTLNVSGTEVNFTWKSEAWVLSSIGFPVGVSSFCRLLMAVTDISVLGRLPNGTIYLAAASMSYVVMDITGTFPSTAADALNALCSQADGAKNPKMIGRWLKIGLCIVILMCPPIMLLWLMTGTILESLGCSPEIAYFKLDNH
uniref:Uncharacterized protein n=1 Tax=Spongospora subterranea TaxID=70186 RepID=A0A0H5RBP0_9EUKA|eukprot:CRZ11640.1 hypothetical protein [Spongospora subterranea]